MNYFVSEAINKKVDVALSNHTAIDNGLERISYLKVRLDYMPNIYIVGQDGFKKYCQVFRTLSYDMLDRLNLSHYSKNKGVMWYFLFD